MKLSEELLEDVKKHFHIISTYDAKNYVELIVEPKGDIEREFEKLHADLVSKGYNVYLDVEGGMLKLKIAWMGITKGKSWKIIALFIATFMTVSFAGYLQISSHNNILSRLGYTPPLDIVEGTIVYAGLFIGALFIHEMGHYVVSRLRGLPVSPPYFIPAPPPYGTFGALINMRSLPARITTLVQVGIAGPLAGFIGALIVSIIGINLSTFIPPEQLKMLPEELPYVEYSPIIYTILYASMVPRGEYVTILHPIAGAGMFLLFITFLNLLPAAQLDGGHVARGVFGEEAHKIFTWLTVFILLVTPYYIFGILIIFLMLLGGGRHPGSMSRISRAGREKYLIGLIYVTLLVLCAPAPVEAVERIIFALTD